MAKICKQCGVKYNNSATKCVMCGTEFDDVHIYAERKKLIILGIVSAIVAVAMIVLIILSTGPKAAVWRIMESFTNNDVEEIIASYPGFLTLSENVDMEALMLDTKYKAKILSEYILSYRIGEPKTPSDKEVKALMEDFRYFAGDDFDESDIEDIKQVLVSYKGNLPVFWTSHATQFTMVKYNGRWCLWPDAVWETSTYA